MDNIQQDAVDESKLPQTKPRKKFTYKFGIGLLILYPFLYLIPVIAPFTSFSFEIKAAIVAGAVIVAEIILLIGIVFVGKEVVKKYRAFLNPKNWFNRRREERDGD